MLVVGGGATGCGVALDGAMRGLKVACVERGDFASETSSRSSKLLWGGSKYIATATAQLFSWKTLTEPLTAIERYYSEMKMVLHCHQERTYMMETHPHLVNWVPLAIPFRSWIMWEPVLGQPAPEPELPRPSPSPSPQPSSSPSSHPNPHPIATLTPTSDHPLFMILPLIAPLFTKFYDSLSVRVRARVRVRG